jgi:hypothetical protein
MPFTGIQPPRRSIVFPTRNGSVSRNLCSALAGSHPLRYPATPTCASSPSFATQAM